MCNNRQLVGQFAFVYSSKQEDSRFIMPRRQSSSKQNNEFIPPETALHPTREMVDLLKEILRPPTDHRFLTVIKN